MQVFLLSLQKDEYILKNNRKNNFDRLVRFYKNKK